MDTVTYELTVCYDTGCSDTGTCETFDELSAAIDHALMTPGFVSYSVRGI